MTKSACLLLLQINACNPIKEHHCIVYVHYMFAFSLESCIYSILKKYFMEYKANDK